VRIATGYTATGTIWEGKDTTYKIQENFYVCQTVDVSTYAGSDELTPKLSNIMGLVTHDCTGNAWVKLDFNNGTAYSFKQSDVNKTAPNIGWFVFYNAGSGDVQFRDAIATSIGTAKMEVAFTASSRRYLAPGPGNYNTIKYTAANAYHFFWADNTRLWRNKGYQPNRIRSLHCGP
jgi:hypothetical protein